LLTFLQNSQRACIVTGGNVIPNPSVRRKISPGVYPEESEGVEMTEEGLRHSDGMEISPDA
jgi:hypothetical protein